MKTIITMTFVMLMCGFINAQSDQQNIRAYCKSMAGVLFKECPVELSPRGLNWNILDWEKTQHNGKPGYKIELDIKWTEGELFGARQSWLKGFLIVNELGCDAWYIITDYKIIEMLGMSCLRKPDQKGIDMIRKIYGIENFKKYRILQCLP